MCSRKKESILPFFHEREKIHMRKFYTAEAVTEGHLDKILPASCYFHIFRSDKMDREISEAFPPVALCSF